MKILKPGRVEQRKFVCPDCGCEFAVGEGEETVYWDDNDCIATCPMCRERLLWRDGEPYEEPTQSDEERLVKLLREWRHNRSEEFAVSCANYLIAHGVTFREDET